MGSVSGALAGEAGNSMAVGGDFFWGDSTPIEEAENTPGQSSDGLGAHLCGGKVVVKQKI